MDVQAGELAAAQVIAASRAKELERLKERSKEDMQVEKQGVVVSAQ